MGNLSWTIVVGLILTVSYGIYASSKTDIETTAVQANYQEQVLAREVARSGYNVALSNLERNFTTYRPSDHVVSMNSGTYRVDVTGPSAGPVTVSVLGSLIDTDHRIEAGVQRKHYFPDAVSIDGEIDEVVASGSYTISGLDTDPTTLIPGSGGGRGTHAIKANNAATVALLNAATDTARVRGVKGYGDIEYRALQVEVDSLIAEVANEASLLSYTGDQMYSFETFGSVSSPAFVEVSGNVELTGTATGCGVLVVHGDLVMNNTARWEGLVISRGGNNVDLLGSSVIVGGLLVSMEAAQGTSDGVGGSCETVRYPGESDDDDDGGSGGSVTCPPSSYDGNDDDDGETVTMTTVLLTTMMGKEETMMMMAMVVGRAREVDRLQEARGYLRLTAGLRFRITPAFILAGRHIAGV